MNNITGTIITGLDVEQKKSFLPRQVSNISTSPEQKQKAWRILQMWKKPRSGKKDETTNNNLELRRLELEHEQSQQREQHVHEERRVRLKYCMIALIVTIIAILLIVLAIVLAVVLPKKNGGSSGWNPLNCPESKVVYLTKERQEVPLEGVTYIGGQPIPSLTYTPIIFDKSAEYAAPANFIITRNSVGKTFPIEVKLKDAEGEGYQCRYTIKVKGKTFLLLSKECNEGI